MVESMKKGMEDVINVDHITGELLQWAVGYMGLSIRRGAWAAH